MRSQNTLCSVTHQVCLASTALAQVREAQNHRHPRVVAPNVPDVWHPKPEPSYRTLTVTLIPTTIVALTLTGIIGNPHIEPYRVTLVSTLLVTHIEP